MNRIELKYYINLIDYINLINRMSVFFSRDENINEDGYYHVRSLYFDNSTNDNYYEKIYGVENRKKYRIRVYNLSPQLIKFEIKTKINNVILKESLPISQDELNRIMSGDYSPLLFCGSETGRKIYSCFSKDHYRPVVIIDYRRDAYYLDINDIRITFDTKVFKNELDLREIFNKNIDMTEVFNNNKIIMEIKYNNHIPTWIKRTLQLPRFERCAISKYTLSRYIE